MSRPHGAHLLGAEALHLEYPTREVLGSVSLGINEGDRVGIVGRNGDGKSSLIGLLAGTIQPDSGRVTRRSGVRVGVLGQRDDLSEDATVGEAIAQGRPEYEWAGDPRIRDVVDGLAKDLDLSATVGRLSGGQRRRVALAAVLARDWDVIALDEPTNHLDVEGISWLAAHLKRRWSAGSGGLMVVTHDRWFLDEVATTTWEVHDRTVEPFEGGYAAYILQRVERDRQAAAVEAKRQNLMRKELAWLRRGAPARTSKPKFRLDAASALIEDVPEPRDRIELNRLATARLGKDVIDLEDVSAAYGEKAVLDHVTWRLGPGARVGVLGANGAGKSTLLGLVSGAVAPVRGRVKRGKTVHLAILDQEFSDLAAIQDDLVREVLARTRTTFRIDGKDYTPAQLLERLGFSSAHLKARVKELSGGQKRRLQFLLVLLDEPNVLLLDEPTNDVDTDMLAAMEDMLDSWPGTLIVVSHDRYFMERATDDLFAVMDGGLRHLPGGIDQYLELRRREEDGEGAGTPSTAERSDGARTHTLRKEVGAAERRMDKVSEQIDRVHVQMADHDPSDFEGLADLNRTAQSLQEELAEAESRWLSLSEELEEN